MGTVTETVTGIEAGMGKKDTYKTAERKQNKQGSYTSYKDPVSWGGKKRRLARH